MQETEYMVTVSEKVSIQASVYSPEKVTDHSLVCIITHPYSQWGGSMHNNVVIGIREQLVKAGLPCITFNFRGVGDSTGQMGDGREEQNDLIAMCKFAQRNLQFKQIYIVGYSYGGLIALSTSEKLKNIFGMTLISYPIGFVNHLHPNFTVNFPIQFIHGLSDNIVPVQRVESILVKFKNKPILNTLPTNHFYNGVENSVGNMICEFIEKIKV